MTPPKSPALTEEMQRIYYANDSVVTGTDIARALLEYAGALARNDSSQTVSIPIRREDGSTAQAMLLIGPASQLIYEDEETDGDELRDEVLVAHLNALTAELGQPRAVPAKAAATDPEDVAPTPDQSSLDWL